MTVPRIGTAWDDLGPLISSLGYAIPRIMNPNIDVQQDLKKQLAAHPEIRQKLIDMESQNPGSVEKMYGKQVAYLGQGKPSSEALLETKTRKAINEDQDLDALPNTLSANAIRQKYGLGTKTEEQAKKTQITSWQQQQDINAPLVELAKDEKYQAAKKAGDVAQMQIMEMQASKMRENINSLNTLRSTYKDQNQLVEQVLQGNLSGKNPLTPEQQRAFYSDEGLSKAYETRFEAWKSQEMINLQKAQNREARLSSTELINRQQATSDYREMDKRGLTPQGGGEVLFQISQNPALVTQALEHQKTGQLTAQDQIVIDANKKKQLLNALTKDEYAKDDIKFMNAQLQSITNNVKDAQRTKTPVDLNTVQSNLDDLNARRRAHNVTYGTNYPDLVAKDKSTFKGFFGTEYGGIVGSFKDPKTGKETYIAPDQQAPVDKESQYDKIVRSALSTGVTDPAQVKADMLKSEDPVVRAFAGSFNDKEFLEALKRIKILQAAGIK